LGGYATEEREGAFLAHLSHAMQNAFSMPALLESKMMIHSILEEV
jgi:hypothetical protein